MGRGSWSWRTRRWGGRVYCAHRHEEEVGQRALQGRDRVARLVLERLAVVELDVGAVAAEDGALPELVVGEVDLVRVKSELRLLGYRGGQG